jgi:hypothetical protein
VKRRVVCATMHAEHLHREQVQDRVRSLLARSPLRWTIFVEPLVARTGGQELAPTLDWIAERGHEIAMHVHHHVLVGAPGSTTGHVRGLRPSAADLERCLDECLDYLTRRGHAPVGFVSGFWLVRDEIFRWLAEHGFLYDCTLRTYAAAGAETTLVPDEPCPTIGCIASLVEVPTTATLQQQLVADVTRTRRSAVVGNLCYDLYYLHDVDVLNLRHRAAVRTVDFMARRAESMTVGQLVGALGSVSTS